MSGATQVFVAPPLSTVASVAETNGQTGVRMRATAMSNKIDTAHNSSRT